MQSFLIKSYFSLCFFVIVYANANAQPIELRNLPNPRFVGIHRTIASISGSHALSEIIDVARWRKLLNVNAEDLEELKVLRQGKRIEEEIRMISRSKKIENFLDLEELRERLIGERMAEILDPNQLSIRRIQFLKEKFHLPISVFEDDSTLLLELGMSNEEFAGVQARVFPKGKEIRFSLNELRIESLSQIAGKLTAEKAERLWRLCN
jgi:hypothetical protein